MKKIMKSIHQKNHSSDTGYKQTEVGVIPEDWKVTTVGQIAEVKTGPFGSALHEKDYVDVGTPIITVEHLGECGVHHTNLPMVSDADKLRLSAYSLRQGDIVFSRVGSVDRNALIKAAEDGWLFSGRLLRVRLKRKDIDAPYLSFHFHSETFKQRVRDVAVGQTMASINTQILMGVKTVFPPTKAEQEAIAEALSDADALIESLEQLIAKKRQVKQGAMQELLTGKKRLPGFTTESGYKQTEVGVIPEDWEVAGLAEICSMKSGEGITSANIDECFQYPCYGGNGLRGFTTRYTHDGGYALIGRQGALCGNVLGVEGKFFASEHAIVVTASARTDIRWLTFVLSEMKLNQYSESSAQPGLSVSKLIGLLVSLPPTKAEQEAIAAILSDMDAEIAALEEKLVKARQIKLGMMQELLTGRIRLLGGARGRGESRQTASA